MVPKSIPNFINNWDRSSLSSDVVHKDSPPCSRMAHPISSVPSLYWSLLKYLPNLMGQAPQGSTAAGYLRRIPFPREPQTPGSIVTEILPLLRYSWLHSQISMNIQPSTTQLPTLSLYLIILFSPRFYYFQWFVFDFGYTTFSLSLFCALCNFVGALFLNVYKMNHHTFLYLITLIFYLFIFDLNGHFHSILQSKHIWSHHNLYKTYYMYY